MPVGSLAYRCRIERETKEKPMIPDGPHPYRGIYAATICPFAPDGSIDEAALARHLADTMTTEGIVGVLINGHAGENAALSRAEKKRVVEIATTTIGERAIIVCGINAESSHEAALHARDAEAAGADMLLVFPPFSWALSVDSTMALNHHRIVGAATSLPLMLYQAGVGTRDMAYDAQTLAALVQLPRVVAIKEGSWESARYEANLRLVRRVAPHVAVMASGDEHLLTCMAIGSEGSLVSIAVLVPDVVVGLVRAIAASDLPAARALNDRIYPLATAIYGTAPSVHANARLKACLKLMGRISNAAVRPPVGPLPPDEIAMLERALADAGVLTTPAATSSPRPVGQTGVRRALPAATPRASPQHSPNVHRRKELAK
jgi:4-hydroxy-tetrahydrodipicolinate synthase